MGGADGAPSAVGMAHGTGIGGAGGAPPSALRPSVGAGLGSGSAALAPLCFSNAKAPRLVIRIPTVKILMKLFIFPPKSKIRAGECTKAPTLTTKVFREERETLVFGNIACDSEQPRQEHSPEQIRHHPTHPVWFRKYVKARFCVNTLC